MTRYFNVRIGLIILCNILLMILLVCLNFYVTNKYQEVSIANKMIEIHIEQEKQLLTTINAEFAYVTSPKYLKPLAVKYLNLSPVSAKQIVQDLAHASSINSEGAS